MYIPTQFAMADGEADAVLASVGAADLITAGPDGMIATFLPLEYDPDAHVLRGHVARTNPHWQAVEHASSSLVIVHGPDGYVSPTYYPSKADNPRVVPTWNYTSVHVHGRLTVHTAPEWLLGLVTRLTERYEAASPRPWAVSDAPADYLAGMLRAIVGLELEIDRVEGKAKLSQNRPAADQAGVVAALERLGAGQVPTAAQLAAAMRRAGS
jgi:transcriptional regulator